MKKYYQDEEKKIDFTVAPKQGTMVEVKSKTDLKYLSKFMDKWTFIGSLFFIITFNIIYWSVAKLI